MIKPIETEYNGYRFRSRLEARWAVFFDALGVEYQYESEGFEFENGTRYLPDFWLPHLKLWYEVKGRLSWQRDDSQWVRYISPELELLRRFRDGQEWPVACAIGGIGNHQIWFFAWDITSSGGGPYEEADATWCVSKGIITLDVNPGRPDRHIFSDNLMGDALPWFTWPYEHGYSIGPIESAINAARSARFEFGENPSPRRGRRRRRRG